MCNQRSLGNLSPGLGSVNLVNYNEALLLSLWICLCALVLQLSPHVLPVAQLHDGGLAGEDEEQGGRNKLGMVKSPA